MIEVVSGVWRVDKWYFVAQREGPRHPGKWEFPGGKVDEGENPRAALTREWEEEFSIEVLADDLILDFVIPEVDEGNGDFRLKVYTVRKLCRREAKKNVHREIAWLREEDLIALAKGHTAMGTLDATVKVLFPIAYRGLVVN